MINGFGILRSVGTIWLEVVIRVLCGRLMGKCS